MSMSFLILLLYADQVTRIWISHEQMWRNTHCPSTHEYVGDMRGTNAGGWQVGPPPSKNYTITAAYSSFGSVHGPKLVPHRRSGEAILSVARRCQPSRIAAVKYSPVGEYRGSVLGYGSPGYSSAEWRHVFRGQSGPRSGNKRCQFAFRSLRARRNWYR